ncbi:hypothetical protein CUMW_125960 [Citrus unshiu]|nr:hypothetical protein CUMW_125960 [Citrus unshiu]
MENFFFLLSTLCETSNTNGGKSLFYGRHFITVRAKKMGTVAKKVLQ